MRILRILAISAIMLNLTSCDKKEESANLLFGLKVSQETSKLHAGTPLSVEIENKKGRAIDSVVYHGFNKSFSTTQANGTHEIPTKNEKLGQHVLRADIYSGGKSYTIQNSIVLLADAAPKIYTYEILEEYPHDIKGYTQGLEFHEGDILYESTGQYGQSSLRKVDLTSGEILKQVDLENQYFGEGLTIFNNKIYQLTWRENVGFVYDLETMDKIDTFYFQNSKEGWGICNDGEYLYKSDGTDRIWRLDPNTLEELDYIQVYTNTGRVREINELEWIEGRVFSNVYTRNAISIINPNTGKLEGVIDLSPLIKEVKNHRDLDVLNGIAYRGEKDIIYVTGKNWNKLFKIKITEN
ncbi:MAG TPA: glutaminyl-peptide cyclotransferase [Flavobacteriaceae bacterium]|nr:glutaminyl-peptide cyclotransferase [Flavobacteriaceae bacterium]